MRYALATTDVTAMPTASPCIKPQKVSTARWNTLSVSYYVPPNMLRALRVSSLSLTLQGQNLALWSNYRGKDPNVNSYSTGNLTADTGQLPQPRVWSLRVSIGN